MNWREEQEKFWQWITRPQNLGTDAAQMEQLFAAPARIGRADALGIYNNAFHQRLIQIAGEMYPVLYHTLGPEVFAQLWLAYLGEHLPRPGPMSRMVDRLLDYTRRHPQFGALPALLDIIQVETLMLNLFDRADIPPLTHAQLTELPPEAWPGTRWQPRGDWALVNSSFDLADYWRRMQAYISSGAPAGSADFGVNARPHQHFLIHRRDFRMQLQPVAKPFADFLTLLQQDLEFAAVCEELGRLYPEQSIPELSLKLLLEAIALELVASNFRQDAGASCLVRAQ